MSNLSPSLAGLFCCILPLVVSHSFVYFVARRGMPISIRWNWRRDEAIAEESE